MSDISNLTDFPVDDALDNLNDVFYVADQNFNIVDWNQRSKNVTGYSDEELESMKIGDFFPEDERQRVLDRVQDILVEGSAKIETELLTKEEERIPYEFKGTRLTDSEGRIVGICGIGRDISERVENTEELREQKRRYTEIVERINDGIFVYRDEGIVFTNQRVSEMTGYSKDELLNMDAFDIIHPDDRERVREIARKRAETEDDALQIYETRILTKQDDVIHVEMNVERVEYEGEPSSLVVARDVTERKQQQERFTQLIENSTDIITVLNSNGKIKYESPAIERVLGYDPDELVGEDAFDYIHPDDADSVFEEFSKAIQNPDHQFVIEYRFKHKDGSWVWVESRGKNMLDNPSVEGFVANSREITQNKLFEEKLDDLRQNARDLMVAETEEEVAEKGVEAAQKMLGLPITAVFLFDDEQNALVPVASTDEAHQLLDRLPTFTPGDSLAWDVFEEGKTRVYDSLEDESGMYNPGTPIRSEVIVPFGDHGIILTGSTEPHDFDDADVDLLRILAANVQVALVRAQHKRVLQNERDRFNSLFESVPEPVTHVEFEDGEPVLRNVNSAFEEVFGYERDEVVGRSPNDFIVPEDTEQDADSLDRRAEDGEEIEAEVQRKTADGEIRDFLFRAVPFRKKSVEDRVASDKSEEVLESVGVYIDITERKEREHELRIQKKRLEEFANLVSHDLRNPLNVAQGYTDIVVDTGDMNYLSRVQKAHQRMRDIIDDVLTIAKHGQAVGETEELYLAKVVNESWENVDTKQAELEVGDLGQIQGEENRLKQMFENLIRNSVEHGGDDITMRVGVLENTDSQEMGFYFEDNGPGIPEEERENVLEHGFTTSETGTGFGLSIVKSIVEAHGWEISVVESDNGGARFEITGAEMSEE